MPDIDPLAAPHSVPVHAGTRWPAALARRWRSALARSAYSRPDTTHPEAGGHRFFQHLM